MGDTAANMRTPGPKGSKGDPGIGLLGPTGDPGIGTAGSIGPPRCGWQRYPRVSG